MLLSFAASYFIACMWLWMGVPPFYRHAPLLFQTTHQSQKEIPLILFRAFLPIMIGGFASISLNQFAWEYLGFASLLPLIAALLWGGKQVRNLIEADHEEPPTFLGLGPLRGFPMALFDIFTLGFAAFCTAFFELA